MWKTLAEKTTQLATSIKGNIKTQQRDNYERYGSAIWGGDPTLCGIEGTIWKDDHVWQGIYSLSGCSARKHGMPPSLLASPKWNKLLKT